MRKIRLNLVLLLVAFSVIALLHMLERLEKEVRHELVMRPYYGMFDNLAFQLEGSKVILLGQVTNPTLRTDAERLVKKVEGRHRREQDRSSTGIAE